MDTSSIFHLLLEVPQQFPGIQLRNLPTRDSKKAVPTAIARLTIVDKPPTIVQLLNAAWGPPVYIAKPNKTGSPLTKFIVVTQDVMSTDTSTHVSRSARDLHVAAQFSNMPKLRMKTCL